MTLVKQLHPEQPNIERSIVSPIRSHESYDDQVEAVCHHSGRYLTRAEINPQIAIGLREQHDFPGFPALDALFARAAHARAYQHVIWSKPAIEGIGMILSGILLLAGVFLVSRRADQWVIVPEFVGVYLGMILAAILGLVLIGIGIRLILQRTAIFHKRAVGSNPTINDYPLLCSYKIDSVETFVADLRNIHPTPPIVAQANGVLMVELQPEPVSVVHYATYRNMYRDPSIGTSFYAGVVAMDGLRYVTFTPDIEYSHRLVLRNNFRSGLDLQTETSLASTRFTAPYQIEHTAMYQGKRDDKRFLLDFQPELAAFDSYTLILRFSWHGSPALTGQLDQCHIVVPPELHPVTRVDSGRVAYEKNETVLVWRNLNFQGNEIALRVTFSKPILQSQPLLTGLYQVSFDGSLSGLAIKPDNVWNALGRRATERTQPQIRSISTLKGSLTVNTALLSQEHEYVYPEQIICSEPPSHDLITSITEALKEGNVSIQRIEQAAPRLDPGGTLQRRLLYWDIVGRHYGASMYEAVDVHIVVSGNDVPLHATQPDNTTQSSIDIRVRALHDPRNISLPAAVNETGKALASLIRDRLIHFA